MCVSTFVSDLLTFVENSVQPLAEHYPDLRAKCCLVIDAAGCWRQGRDLRVCIVKETDLLQNFVKCESEKPLSAAVASWGTSEFASIALDIGTIRKEKCMQALESRLTPLWMSAVTFTFVSEGWELGSALLCRNLPDARGVQNAIEH